MYSDRQKIIPSPRHVEIKTEFLSREEKKKGKKIRTVHFFSKNKQTKEKKPNTNLKAHINKQAKKKQTNKQTNLHMCYRRLIINLTTVKSWMDWGYMDWTQSWYSGEVTCGSSHTMTMSEMTKPPWKIAKIFGRSWEKFKLYCKKDVWCSIAERIVNNIKNQLAIARELRTRV